MAPDNELFSRYLDVCNQALEASKDRFPFKQILGAARAASAPREIAVQIVDHPSPLRFVIAIENDRIHGHVKPACSAPSSDHCWNVPRSYLEKVVNNPADYIQNPARINWEWMYPATGR